MPSFILVFVMTQLLGGTPTSPADLEGLAREALAAVEKMRGQKLSAPLKMGVKSKPKITEFVLKRLEDEYGTDQVTAEGQMLKLQGLLPRDIEYKGLIVKLLTEQVAGFYDHTQQELHIADWLPSALQAPVMAHEIFHAIQDQEWGGGKLIDSKLYNHDEVLAHAALLEGDATIVMMNYSGGAVEGFDVSQSPAMLKMIAASLPMQMSSAQFPTMANAPDYMKQSLIFPYQQGLLFVGALRQSGMSWAQIRDVYRNPPASTEQILHPEKYLGQPDMPSEVTLPPTLMPGFKVAWAGTLGEFHLRQMLLSYLAANESSEGAAGWDGDQTFYLTAGAQEVTVTLSTWDSPKEAQQFKKTLSSQHVRRQAKGDKTHLVIRVEKSDVLFAYAMDAQLAEQAVAAAAKTGKVNRR